MLTRARILKREMMEPSPRARTVSSQSIGLREDGCDLHIHGFFCRSFER